LKTYGGFPVRPGTSRMETAADSKRAIGTVNGQDFVTAEFKPVPGSCEAAAALLNYVSLSPETKQVIVTKIPFVGDRCKAELVSAKIAAASGDAFAAYSISKAIWTVEIRNLSFTLSSPQPAGK
jgi:hypothetical protein